MIKKIIVPTDFSPYALAATLYAIGLAKKIGGEVFLLHAYKAFRSPFQSELANQTDEQRARIGAEKGMKAFLETIVDKGEDFPGASIVKKADLVDAIHQCAEEQGTDIVIMGTHGASGLKEDLLGSNTYEVAGSITIPLLIVPENGTMIAIDHVVFFTDYQDGDEEALIRFARLFGDLVITCTLVHIHEQQNPPTDDDRDKLERWRERLEVASGIGRLEPRLVHGKESIQIVEDTIVDLGATHCLLTLVDSKGFFERITHKRLAKAIIHQPKTPVFIVNDRTV